MSKFLLSLLFTSWEFFTSDLADGFSLEFEWQQVSSSYQDFSHYSGRSQWCCSLDGLHSSSNLQVFQSREATAIMGYSAFTKAPVLQEPYYQLV